MTKASVKIVEVASRVVKDGVSHEQVVPAPEIHVDNGRLAGYGRRGAIATKRLQTGCWGEPSVKISSHSHAYLWKGGSRGRTAPGWGH